MQHTHSCQIFTKRADFLRVQAAQKIVTTSMVVHYIKTQSPQFYLGFTVTKRCGSAVERNRIKRRLRSAVREVAKDTSCAGLELVLVGRPHTLNAPYEVLCKDLRYALKRIQQTAMALKKEGTPC